MSGPTRDSASGAGTGSQRPALLIHSEPSEVLTTLQGCGGLAWEVATSGPEILEALERRPPEVVFSIKHSEFPGALHKPALHSPGLRWLHVGGAGMEHMGLDADGTGGPPGVRVTNSAGVLAPFLGERAMAALLHMSTGMGGILAAQGMRQWRPSRFQTLRGRTMLIVGAGHTGAALAGLAKAFGMRVLGIRASGEMRAGFDAMGPAGHLEEWLPSADVVSLHVRSTGATRHLMNADRLAMLPEGAIVLNSARGAVLDEGALLAALDRNVSAAWLDVFEVEPLPESNPLWRHPRVLVTPHCADQVEDFPRRFAEHFVSLWGANISGDHPTTHDPHG